MSFKRKLKRTQLNKKKKNAEKEIAEKVALFGHLPDACLTCERSFDKMDKQQVMSWSVVVRQQEEKVNLYCPECWEKAMSLVEDLKKRIEEKNG